MSRFEQAVRDCLSPRFHQLREILREQFAELKRAELKREETP